MSDLRRKLSIRKSNRYNALAAEKTLQTPPAASLKKLNSSTDVTNCNIKNSSFRKSFSKSKVSQIKENKKAATSENLKSIAEAENIQPKEFSGLNTMKSAIMSIGKKLKGKQYKKMSLHESPRMINHAYTTPRRSERIKAQGLSTPLSIKMYSPFCIETPGLDDTFSRISKRKALTDISDSPVTKTPRRMVSAGVAGHKKLGASISSTKLAVPSLSGY